MGVLVGDDSDLTLLQRYRAGDSAAFRQLVVRYERPIYNAAFWVLRSAEDARDVAQIVFMRVAERSDEYDPRYKFFSWIYRIAVNESLNLLRRGEREEPLDEGVDYPDSDDADPQWQLHEAQRSRQLREALMKMSATDRTVLTLRHFSELSYREIGEVLDLDEKTVKSRLFEARQRLKSMLPEM
jgi:RNA polymerase sigma-70 factor (ECF subfamily)